MIATSFYAVINSSINESSIFHSMHGIIYIDPIIKAETHHPWHAAEAMESRARKARQNLCKQAQGVAAY
jgi:hypothetical protein